MLWIMIIFVLLHFEIIHTIANKKSFAQLNAIINFETFIETRIFIFSTTVIQAQVIEFSIITIFNATSFFQISAFSVKLNTSISFIFTSTTFSAVINFDINWFSLICNVANSFDFTSQSSWHRSWENYKVNDFIQIFEMHCNRNFSKIDNFELHDFQLISTNNIMTCIIKCAEFNN